MRWLRAAVIAVGLAVLVAAGTTAHRSAEQERTRYRRHQVERLCGGFTVPNARRQLQEIETGIRHNEVLGRGNAERLVTYHLNDPPAEVADEVAAYRAFIIQFIPDRDMNRYDEVRDPVAGAATYELTQWLQANCPKG